MTYGVLIDTVEPLAKADPAKAKGCRFNAYFWATEDDGTVALELFGIGFRVYGGLILPPSYTTRGGTHPNIFLPQPWAAVLVDAVLGDPRIREPFAHLFPLIHREGLIAALMFQVKDAKYSFPEYARQRGLLGD